MNKNETVAASCIGISTTLVAIVVISSIMNGWVLSLLWAWFIIPVFGLPAISIVQAIGLAMVVSFLSKSPINNQDDKKEPWTAIIRASLYTILYPLLTVGTGYIVMLFL